MRSLRLAYALLRVPKLCATLFLVPLLLSVLLVIAQLILTIIIIDATNKSVQKVEERISARKDFNFARKLLYGDGARLSPLKVCRWSLNIDASGKKTESPPSVDCQPNRLDIAIIASNPESFDTSEYERIFNGNVQKLHICRSCQPDIIIHPTSKDSLEMRTDFLSIWGIVLMNLVKFDNSMPDQYVDVVKDVEKIDLLTGELHFNAWGLKSAAKISNNRHLWALLFNIASIVMIALWLAVKAHRKILDYFSRNGALLPLVAATGKGSFYGALWILTLLRVAAFLLAAIPATYLLFRELLEDNPEELSSLSFPLSDLLLWIVAITASFTLATIIASIADLKQRHQFFSMLYTYAPLILAAAGTILWAATFLIDSPVFGYTRNFITALPIIGMTPALLAPLMQPYNWALIVHTLLSIFFIITLLRKNSHWFGAHLEEL